jgi:NDP-sugar pyrophosphorylase family protein
MQAVFLAAGRGTRFGKLTEKTPKPMLKIKGKNLLEHNILKLPDEIDEIIIIVNYLKEQIMDFFGSEYEGRKIQYVYQEELLGTGHAICLCQDIIKDKFLVLMGDDIYSRKDMEKCIQNDLCICVKEVEGEFNGGKIVLDENGNLESILEGEHKNGKNLVNIGMYSLNCNFFKYDLVKIKGREEYGLPQTLISVLEDYPVAVQKTDFWLQINYFKDLVKAREILE